MARLPRLDLPGIARHIVQRGNNRLPCFLDDGDRLRYLHLLREVLLATGVRLHAYVLMDNHVHLLATPASSGEIARCMQQLGRQYLGLFNARHGRTGTLWEGRYKACLVDNECYLLTCQRYIELNPVRARITDNPAVYRWSSCAAHLGQRSGSMLSSHPAWHALGADTHTRARAWRAILDQAIGDDELVEIRRYLQQQRAWGRDDFRAMVEARTERFAGVRAAHRPRKPDK